MTKSTRPDPIDLPSFGSEVSAAVIGATGGLGRAFVEALSASGEVSTVFALSRSAFPTADPKVRPVPIDLEDDASIAQAAAAIAADAGTLHLVIVAAGVLHLGDDVQPEKTWQSLDGRAMERVFRINTVGPALVAKHFLPLLARDRKAAFAALSARIGSISDNQLGGWHAYRASKAALNMMIRNLSIELARRCPDALCVGLHPGTVDTALSKPFQSGVPAEKLFTAPDSAAHLLRVLDRLGPEESGHVFAWDGTRIPS